MPRERANKQAAFISADRENRSRACRGSLSSSWFKHVSSFQFWLWRGNLLDRPGHLPASLWWGRKHFVYYGR